MTASNAGHRPASAVLEGASAPLPASAGPDLGAMTLWAREVLAEAAPGLGAHDIRVEVLRDGVKRLAIVHADAFGPLVLKQYADERGASTLRWLQRLQAAGMTPPARFAVTPPRGWSATHSTLVTDLAVGGSWLQWTLRGPSERAVMAVAAAEWLATLQTIDVDLPVRTDYRAAEELHRNVSMLAGRFPAEAQRLHDLGVDIAARLYDTRAGASVPLVPSHGDFHPENLHAELGESPSVTAFDIDTAGMRRPAYDVGYALAQLLIQSWMQTGSFAIGAEAGLVFWRTWTSDGGERAQADGTDAVGAEIARALVQSLHFELVTYRTGRAELIAPWLAVAESALTDGVAPTLEAFTNEKEVAR